MSAGVGIGELEVGAVALAVRDLATVREFYRAVVGLEVLASEGGSAWLGAGGTKFLELRGDAALRERDPAAAGLYHTAFLLPERADLGRWLRHAGALGVRLDGAADHLVSEAVYLHDPEGNGIEIYADRARATWRWEGDQVVMANDRLDMIGLRALAGSEWQGAPAGTRIGHVHLQVGDTAEAVRFYAGELGFAVTRRWPQAAFFATGGYHHQLAANTWHSAGAGRRDLGRAGLASMTWVTAESALRERLGALVVDPWGTPFVVGSNGEPA